MSEFVNALVAAARPESDILGPFAVDAFGVAATVEPVVIDRETLERAHELALAENETRRLNAMLVERTSDLYKAQRDLIAFKEQVVEVASTYAREHNWCSVVSEALNELDLELKPNTYTAEITVTYTVSFESNEEPSESDLRYELDGSLEGYYGDNFEIVSSNLTVDSIDEDS